MVLDGGIAVPDKRGVTHIDLLTQAMRRRRSEQLAYFAFDLLHLDGHDLRACAIEDRKALLRDVIGAEGIVSKRADSAYRGGPSRDWLKVKVSETAAFVIARYIEREAVAIAEMARRSAGRAGLVKFGLAGKDLWSRLSPLRTGPASRGGVVPVRPEVVARVKFFRRYRSDAIRDGVLLLIG
jgi:bifunctional non-homologous end joining protein LigD